MNLGCTAARHPRKFEADKHSVWYEPIFETFLEWERLPLRQVQYYGRDRLTLKRFPDQADPDL
jgi:hypothetical protein